MFIKIWVLSIGLAFGSSCFYTYNQLKFTLIYLFLTCPHKLKERVKFVIHTILHTLIYPRRKYLSQLSCAALPWGFDSRDPAMVQCGIIGFLEKKQRVMQTLVSLRKSRTQEYLSFLEVLGVNFIIPFKMSNTSIISTTRLDKLGVVE